MISRLLWTGALTTLLLPGCAADLSTFHARTANCPEPLTNIEAAISGFPAEEGEKLVIPPDVEEWLGSKCATPPPAGLVSADQARVIVHTDVDDTVIASLWDRGRHPKHAVYPGVLDLLLAQGGAPETRALVALTARPTAGGTHRDFCRWFAEELHDETACAQVGVSTGQLGDESYEMGLVKAEALLEQARNHPGATLVFNGDSGQGDWIAALVARDLAPAHLRYATIHDVRAWSPEHRDELHDDLLASEHLAALYRRFLPRGPNEPRIAHAARVERRIQALRDTVDAVLDTRTGRLDEGLLRRLGIFLHRNHVSLALDLAEAGHISPEAARRVAQRALPHLRFVRENRFGFDRRAEREELIRRLRALMKTLPARACPR